MSGTPEQPASGRRALETPTEAARRLEGATVVKRRRCHALDPARRREPSRPSVRAAESGPWGGRQSGRARSGTRGLRDRVATRASARGMQEQSHQGTGSMAQCQVTRPHPGCLDHTHPRSTARRRTIRVREVPERPPGGERQIETSVRKVALSRARFQFGHRDSGCSSAFFCQVPLQSPVPARVPVDGRVGLPVSPRNPRVAAQSASSFATSAGHASLSTRRWSSPSTARRV